MIDMITWNLFDHEEQYLSQILKVSRNNRNIKQVAPINSYFIV